MHQPYCLIILNSTVQLMHGVISNSKLSTTSFLCLLCLYKMIWHLVTDRKLSTFKRVIAKKACLQKLPCVNLYNHSIHKLHNVHRAAIVNRSFFALTHQLLTPCTTIPIRILWKSCLGGFKNIENTWNHVNCIACLHSQAATRTQRCK